MGDKYRIKQTDVSLNKILNLQSEYSGISVCYSMIKVSGESHRKALKNALRRR